MLNSILCDCIDAYILVSGTAAIDGTGTIITQNGWMKEIKK